MKFAKLLRPMFLVALGIHALALFLPMGDASETVEVKNAEEKLTEGTSLSTPGRLPVPDPNVTAAGDLPAAVSAPVGLFGSPFSALPAASKPPVPASQPLAPARSAPLAAAVPNPASAVSAVRPNAAASSPSVNSPPALPAAAQNEAVNNLPPLTLSDLGSANGSDAASQMDSDSVEVPVTEGSTEIATLSSPSEASTNEAQPNQSLIASALTQLPDSLKALMNKWAIALAYSSKNTSDRSAKANASKWTDKINAQAGDIGVSNLEPLKVEDFTSVSYPIEPAERENKQSFRVCLEQPPGAAEVGVLFDAQGEIISEPELIRSTGYAVVNNKLITAIKSAEDLPNDRQLKAFIFEVAVDYDADVCTSLSELKK